MSSSFKRGLTIWSRYWKHRSFKIYTCKSETFRGNTQVSLLLPIPKLSAVVDQTCLLWCSLQVTDLKPQGWDEDEGGEGRKRLRKALQGGSMPKWADLHNVKVDGDVAFYSNKQQSIKKESFLVPSWRERRFSVANLKSADVSTEQKVFWLQVEAKTSADFKFVTENLASFHSCTCRSQLRRHWKFVVDRKSVV